MSGAIISGLISAGTYDPKDIYLVDIAQSQLDKFTAQYKTINTSTAVTKEIIDAVTIVLIGTKPGYLAGVVTHFAPLLDQKKHVVVSICAGIPTSTINQIMTTSYNKLKLNVEPVPFPIPVVRVMPNTPALVQAGASGICKGQFATDVHMTMIKTVMSAVGLAVIVGEGDIDAVTGVSGSGPAYVLAFIESLTAGGVAAGLTYPISYQLALETVFGTAKMLKDTQQHPAVLREQICSPGGTTITGLKALHENNFQNAIMQCVLDATSRGAYLAEKANGANKEAKL
jgi:pyrroline-5-carboxylate reductase